MASVYLLKRIINRRQLSWKSMMARAEEQRPRWTEEEDHKLIECKSRNPHLSWPNIAMLAGLERSGKSCRERWNNSLTEDNTLQWLHGNSKKSSSRASRWNNQLKKKLGIRRSARYPIVFAPGSSSLLSKKPPRKALEHLSRGGPQHPKPQGFEIDMSPKGLIHILTVEEIDGELQALSNQGGEEEETGRCNLKHQQPLSHIDPRRRNRWPRLRP
ncbi:transcription factor MYB102-like [Vitis riparia]|uniref:transcription factor MYB102-like n=1 Tax=Vitis riparia TaxID=96939 RepID=UPI00155A7D09|nr:transcription factor MYB102-like [Vitis riparia]